MTICCWISSCGTETEEEEEAGEAVAERGWEGLATADECDGEAADVAWLVFACCSCFRVAFVIIKLSFVIAMLAEEEKHY